MRGRQQAGGRTADTAAALGVGDVRGSPDAVALANAALAEVALLRRALDALPLGVVLADGEGTVTFRNRPAQSLVGARHSDALAARAVDEVLANARAGQADSRTVELYGPPARTVVVRAEPIGGATLATLHDISERRQVDQVRRDFVANVSHELRTPVGALAVLAEALADEQDPEIVRRLAGRITTEVERAGRLIEDLLDLSRLEFDGGRRDDRLLPLASVVAGAVERVAGTAARRSVALDVEAIPAGLAVRGDETQLVSAVANLLDNGVKYSEAGGRVRVSVRPTDTQVDVVVADRGIGIPSREIERIFERFYRVDRARSRQTGGTGLGLSIVRHVAVNHGGQILVSSREGDGSTFTLRLPRSPT